MPKVFISHSTRDRDFVEREIIGPLKAQGIETWYSTDSIRTAELWERSIREGLKSCDWFLIVMSPNSVSSKWVPREMLWAMERREGRIVPVLIDDCAPEDLHLGLLAIQHIDFRRDKKKAQSQLLAIFGVSDEVNDLYGAALAALAEEDWAGAIQQLLKLLELNPRHEEAKDQLRHARQQKFLAGLYGAGLKHFNAGQWQESLEDLRQVRELEGEYKEVHSLIARAEHELAKSEEESRALEEQERKALEAKERRAREESERQAREEEERKAREEKEREAREAEARRAREEEERKARERAPQPPLATKTKDSTEPADMSASLAEPDGRKVSGRVWIASGALLAGIAILVVVFSRGGSGVSPAGTVDATPSTNINRASNVAPTPNVNTASVNMSGSINGSFPAQSNSSPSPTPTPGTTQLILTQIMSTADERDTRVGKSNIKIEVGGDTFQKLTNSKGIAVFDVPCGGEVKITAWDTIQGRNQTFRQTIGCDNPQVGYVIHQDMGLPMKLEKGKPGRARYFDGDEWRDAETRKVIPNSRI